MADQTVAQSGALRRPFPEKTSGRPVLLQKVEKGWKVGWCWVRYLRAGARGGVPELAGFLVRNHFFTAMQVAGELTALGPVLAKLRPNCALEIGTAYGGTLLFLTRLASPQATIVSVDIPRGRFGGGYGRARAWLCMGFARR